MNDPNLVFIEITNNCTAKCHGCEANKNEKELSIEEFRKILDNIHPSIKLIGITGGEPFDHPNLTELLKVLDERKRDYFIFTNGLWKKPEKILKYLKKSPHFKGLSFSVHGPNPASHQQFTQIESCTKILESIKKSVEEGLLTQTNTVIGEHNKRDLKNLITFLHEAGVNLMVFSRYVGPIRNGISIFKEELNTLLGFLKEVKETGMPIVFGHCLPLCYNNFTGGCRAGEDFYHIDINGNLHACSFSPAILGDIKKDTAENIRNSDEFQNWIKNRSIFCEGCEILDDCRSGCRAVREILGIRKDPLMWEPIKTKKTRAKKASVPAKKTTSKKTSMVKKVVPAAKAK